MIIHLFGLVVLSQVGQRLQQRLSEYPITDVGLQFGQEEVDTKWDCDVGFYALWLRHVDDVRHSPPAQGFELIALQQRGQHSRREQRPQQIRSCNVVKIMN